MDCLTGTTIDELMEMIEYERRHPLSEKEIKKRQQEIEECEKLIDSILNDSNSEEELEELFKKLSTYQN